MTNDSKSKILIVDDHPIVRQGIRQIIEHEEDLAVCGEADDTASALEEVQRLNPDMALIDVSLKGRSGIELIKDIRASGLDVPILVLSVHDEATYAERALRAGAQGYLMKREPPELVIQAIRKILSGQLYVSERIATRLLSRLVAQAPDTTADSPVACLSDRELEVLELIGRGRATREIADQLHLSISTIETYRMNIKHKLALETAAELAKYAAEWLLGE